MKYGLGYWYDFLYAISRKPEILSEVQNLIFSNIKDGDRGFDLDPIKSKLFGHLCIPSINESSEFFELKKLNES